MVKKGYQNEFGIPKNRSLSNGVQNGGWIYVYISEHHFCGRKLNENKPKLIIIGLE